MVRSFLLAGVVALLAVPALGQGEYNFAPACTAPRPPATIDGRRASQQQLDAARVNVQAFIRASDSYQQCLGRALGSRQDLAFSTHSNVPVRIVKQIQSKAAANQNEKVRVGREYNEAVMTFRARSGTGTFRAGRPVSAVAHVKVLPRKRTYSARHPHVSIHGPHVSIHGSLFSLLGNRTHHARRHHHVSIHGNFFP
jgi:hypothetical protein